MNARIATATRLGFREQARRPFLIALLVVVPFVFITKAIASTEAIPRRIGLPGGGESSSFHAWGYLAVALGCSRCSSERWRWCFGGYCTSDLDDSPQVGIISSSR